MTTHQPAIATSGDGTPIVYDCRGEGPPLVLVHGSLVDRTYWAKVVPALADHFAVYTLDRRGHGSSGDGAVYTLELEADDVLSVLDSIGEPVYLMGHSFGGRTALEAARRAASLRSLVLYEPAVQTAADTAFLSQLTVGAHLLESALARGEGDAALAEFQRAAMRYSEADIERRRALPMWADQLALLPTLPREMRALAESPFEPDRFTTLAVPVLLLLGTESSPIQKSGADLLQRTLPNTRLVTLPGQGHNAVLQAPDLVVRSVLGFLSGREA